MDGPISHKMFVGSRLKKAMGTSYFTMIGFLSRAYTREASPRPMSSDFRRVLVREFRDDVSKLSELLERDLSGWCPED